MPAFEPHWTAYLTPIIQFLTAVAAVVVAYRFGAIQAGIAKQQAATAVAAAQTAAAAAQTARNRLKFDLFERRLSMYDLIYAYLDSVASEQVIDPKADSEFLASVRALGWITDKAVVTYVHKDLRGQMIELSRLTRQLETTDQLGPARAELMMQHSVLTTNLFNEHETLAKMFEPYLKLEH